MRLSCWSWSLSSWPGSCPSSSCCLSSCGCAPCSCCSWRCRSFNWKSSRCCESNSWCYRVPDLFKDSNCLSSGLFCSSRSKLLLLLLTKTWGGQNVGGDGKLSWLAEHCDILILRTSHWLLLLLLWPKSWLLWKVLSCKLLLRKILGSSLWLRRKVLLLGSVLSFILAFVIWLLASYIFILFWTVWYQII